MSAVEMLDHSALQNIGHPRPSVAVMNSREVVITSSSRPMKLGASEKGSTLLLLDGTTNPGLHVLARDGTSLVLQNPDGRKRVVEP